MDIDYDEAEAVRTVSGVPGVRHVENGLRVRLMDGEGRADADTEAAVLDALIADEEVDAGDVWVESRDGAVTLSGGATSIQRLPRSTLPREGREGL